MTMHQYNAAMASVVDRLPTRMRSLPITEDGWPQLWFAGITSDGKPDLRYADPSKRVRAINRNLCWLCGQPVGSFKAFIIGPMCAITRTTSEPPCHRECAEFSVIACPFLSKPRMKRNEVNQPEERMNAPGTLLKRNPGVVCLWICKTFKTFRTGQGSDWLIRVGDPTEVNWYAEGCPATRNEIMESIDIGFPLLQREAELDGTEAISQLSKHRNAVTYLLPN